MQILVTGGAGFLGSRLVDALLSAQDAGQAPIKFAEIVAVDLVENDSTDARVTSAVGDLTDSAFLESLIGPDTVAIYHLAAILSGGSAQDFDLALKVNVDGTRALLDAARASGSTPLFIFTSSLAVFGGTMPEVVGVEQATQPDSTYGATKSIGELLVNEYSRKGYIDGRICRLPTISVRPGSPNSAASSFASGIIREPLNGLPSTCPVPHETRMWLSSPDTVISNLLHVLSVPAQSLPSWRALNLPGIMVTVGQMLNSLERVAGKDARALVTDEMNAEIMEIVCSWPGEFDVQSTLALGFTADTTFDAMVEQYRTAYVR